MKSRLIVWTCMMFFSLGNAGAQDSLPLSSKAPLFEALDADSQHVSLTSLLEKGPVVVAFYRGQWCPYCNKHMSDLQDSLDLITNLGASLVAITPESDEAINKTKRKSGASFSIIYDREHQIMDAYQVTFKSPFFRNLIHWGMGININKASGNDDSILPVPATYIIDTDGRIIGRHFDRNYKERMSVRAILKALKTVGSWK